MQFHPFRVNEKNLQRVLRSTETDSTRPAKASRYLRRGVAAEKRRIFAITRERFNSTTLHREFVWLHFPLFYACISLYESAFVFCSLMSYHYANYRVTLFLSIFPTPFLQVQHTTRWRVSAAIGVSWIVHKPLSIASIVSSRPLSIASIVSSYRAEIAYIRKPSRRQEEWIETAVKFSTSLACRWQVIKSRREEKRSAA